MIKNFKFIDLFCGIGGFHQAMSSLGGTCVYACDIDKECRQTYFNNYGIEPDSDITKVDETTIEPFDVLCAGFPCQSFSVSGKRLGFLDQTRGTLFFDVIRIAKYHKPKYMLLENVKNLASHDNGHTWEVIYNTIQEAGYNVSKTPTIFSPHYLGIPQHRERVLIMCVRKDIGELPEFKFNTKRIPQCTIESILQDDSEIENIEKYRINKEQEQLINLWDAFVKMTKGQLPSGVIFGEAFNTFCEVKSFAKWCQGYVEKCHEWYLNNKEMVDQWKEKAKSVSMYKNSRMHMEWHADRNEESSCWNCLIQFRESGIRFKRANTFPTLVAMVQTSIVGSRKRFITPREAARLQSFPETFKLNKTDKIAYKQLGNSVNVEVIKLFAKFLLGDQETQNKYSELTLF